MTTTSVRLPRQPVERRFLPDWAHSLLRGVAQLLVTAGLLVGLFLADELWFSNYVTAYDQHHLSSELTKTWATEASAPAGSAAAVAAAAPVRLGHGIAIIYIPAFGSSYHFVVVQGTDTQDLQEGPGHIIGTPYPGQVGNVVISGHRTTYLHPFYELGSVKVGDAIVLETEKAYYTYRVTSTEVVLPTDVAVAAPVPDRPGVRPTQAYLTLTTCDPPYSASHRLVVHALLSATSRRADGPPTAMRQAA